MNRSIRALLAILGALGGLAPGASHAITWHVPGQAARISDALFAAGPGDTIQVAAGTYAAATNAETFPITISKEGIVLLGAGMGHSVLDAADANTVVRIEARYVRVSGFTITRGNAYRGGGVYIATASLGGQNWPVVDHNLVLACGAVDRGSGIWAEDNTAPWIHHNVVWQSYDSDLMNGADPHGIQLQNANGVIEHNLVGRGDSNGLFNGGPNSAPIMRNNIVAWNGTVPSKGRGFCALGSPSTVIANNLFFDNVLPSVLMFVGGVPMDLSAAEANAVSPSDPVYANFEADPLLLDADAHDFRLAPTSPAIDAGEPGSPLDPDGTPADIGPFWFDQATVGVPPGGAASGRALTLSPATPNPFAARTALGFTLARAGRVRVHVVDGRGARVAMLLDAELPAGPHSIAWDGRTADGASVATGVYFARVALDGESEIQKLLLLR